LRFIKRRFLSSQALALLHPTMYRVFALLCLATVLVAADDQQDALTDLYHATAGDSWARRDGWLQGDYCTWFGVSCDHDPPGTSQVTSVSLPGNKLKGAIPDSIAKMANLKLMILNGNELTGSVPGYLASLPDLQMVYLQNNKLSGALPPMMMNLTEAYPKMQEIDLSYNSISGPIPDTIFGPEKLPPFFPKASLKVFNLRYNAITGDIPTRIVHTQSMVSLLLGGNNMTGAVDSSLQDFLTHRKYCDLSGNDWTCPLPDGVAAACGAVCK